MLLNIEHVSPRVSPPCGVSDPSQPNLQGSRLQVGGSSHARGSSSGAAERHLCYVTVVLNRAASRPSEICMWKSHMNQRSADRRERNVFKGEEVFLFLFLIPER